MNRKSLDFKLMRRQLIMLLGDILAISATSLFALLLRFDLAPTSVPEQYISILNDSVWIIIGVFLLQLLLFRLYSSLWEFAGIDELIRVVCATFLAEAVVLLFGVVLDAMLPRSYYVLDWILKMLVIGGGRLGYRVLRRLSLFRLTFFGKQERVLLIGAGKMGTMMLNELANEEYKFGRPVLFADDDPAKKGKRINGVLIAGSCAELAGLVKKYYIDKIIFCIPSAALKDRKRILNSAIATGCRVMVAQSIHGSLVGEKDSKNIRDVEVTDLLARPVVELNEDVCGYIRDQVVLVTGGGGSIGSELCRQAAKCRPKRIVIFDIYENNAYELLNELKQTYGELIDVCIRIGSVCDSKRLEQIFCEFTPSVIFHAAAHKHVPLLQDSPCEAIKNNVFGTLNTAKAAGKYGAKRFVLLSTDKAVNPTSIMGASKRITEMIIQAVNWHNQTIYTAVRFGNVLGSSGSVVPLFQKQIENGGPVTVTHPDMTRYFMTIPEAAQLVVQAGGLATGGELFVLDMGEPVKILDLAYNLIKLSGLEPDTDIKIRFTGLRPGEKLYEELSYQDEEINRQSTQHSKIFIVPPVAFDTRVFRTQLDNLKEYAEIGDVPALYAELNEVIYGCLKNEAKEHRLLTYGKGNEISDSCKTTLSQDSAGTMTHVSA